MPAIRSKGSLVAGAVLSALILLVWAVLLATLTDLGSSDAMGNALARGFATLEIILVWILLAVMVIIETAAGAFHVATALAALGLLVASGLAAVSAVDLLADPGLPPFHWPIMIVALIPPALVAFGLWGLVPALRAAVPASIASGMALGGMCVLSALILPMMQIRERANQHAAQQRLAWANDFASLPDDAPLWRVTPFVETSNNTRQQAALDRIRHLDRRQADAEAMLDRGDFPMAYLAAFDLDPTPALCGKARGLLRRRAQSLVPKTPGRPYAGIAGEVAGAVSAMEWLAGYGCSCDDEALAWEAMASEYRGSNFDVVRLHAVRDPAELGRRLREDPAHFSMLTPQSHLKAWLKFAEDTRWREPALAGARQLPRRTEDAVEIMLADRSGAYILLMYLPALDLQATPAFCAASLRLLHDEFAPIYRPSADDPRSYEELLERLGAGRPLDALVWVASHGCDASGVLNEAQQLLRDYQASPERDAILSQLAQLRNNP
jgi:hypothetical protein